MCLSPCQLCVHLLTRSTSKFQMRAAPMAVSSLQHLSNPAFTLLDREVRRLSAERAAISAQLVQLVEGARRMVGGDCDSTVFLTAVVEGGSRPLDWVAALRADCELTLAASPPSQSPPVGPNPHLAANNENESPPLQATRPRVVQTIHRAAKEASPPGPSALKTGALVLPVKDLRNAIASRASTPEVRTSPPPPPRVSSDDCSTNNVADKYVPPPTLFMPAPAPLHPTHKPKPLSRGGHTPSSSAATSRASSVAKELTTFDVEDRRIVGTSSATAHPDEEDLELPQAVAYSSARSRFGEEFSSTPVGPTPSAPARQVVAPQPRPLEPRNPNCVVASHSLNSRLAASRASPPATVLCRSREPSPEAAGPTQHGGIRIRRQSSRQTSAEGTSSALGSGREWMLPSSAGRPRLH